MYYSGESHHEASIIDRLMRTDGRTEKTYKDSRRSRRRSHPGSLPGGAACPPWT